MCGEWAVAAFEGQRMTRGNRPPLVLWVRKGCGHGQGPGQAAVYRLAGKAEGRARRPHRIRDGLKTPEPREDWGRGGESRGWEGSAGHLETGSRIQE